MVSTSFWALALQILVGSAQPAGLPQITPLFSRIENSPSFYVECTNQTGSPVLSNADMWPWVPSRLRIDGQPLPVAGYIGPPRIGPGLGGAIEPGGVWRGIVTLRQADDGRGASLQFGAMVRSIEFVRLAPGRHTIAVQFGESGQRNPCSSWRTSQHKLRVQKRS